MACWYRIGDLGGESADAVIECEGVIAQGGEEDNGSFEVGGGLGW